MPITKVDDYSVSFVQVLNESGEVDSELEPDLDESRLIRLYRGMLLARRADERMLKLQRQGRMGTFPPCIGQEAASCGVVLAMDDDDWMVPAFRELGGQLMRGLPLVNHYLFFNGWEEGNVLPEKKRLLPIAIIVGSQTLHAAGIAYAMKYRSEKSVVVCFLGDGATSQGDFHEALNFASVWQAPVVFVVQNNHWAISVPRSKQSRSRTLAQKAIGYDMPGYQVDGNDALAMYRTAKEAIDRARDGGGPTLIEAVTYRLMMHTTADDPRKYRTEDEEKDWWSKDPLPRLRSYLENKGLMDDKRHAVIEEQVQAAVADAVKELETEVKRRVDIGFDHVFAHKHPYIEAQRAHFLTRTKEGAHA